MGPVERASVRIPFRRRERREPMNKGGEGLALASVGTLRPFAWGGLGTSIKSETPSLAGGVSLCSKTRYGTNSQFSVWPPLWRTLR